jgi:hypothetical protein
MGIPQMSPKLPLTEIGQWQGATGGSANFSATSGEAPCSEAPHVP